MNKLSDLTSFHCKFAYSGPSLGGRCALLASISVNWEVKNHAEIDTKTGLNEPVNLVCPNTETLSVI